MAPEKHEEQTNSNETLADYAPFQTKTLTTEEARQGATGHGVRYVLAVSLGLSLMALYLAWAHVI